MIGVTIGLHPRYCSRILISLVVFVARIPLPETGIPPRVLQSELGSFGERTGFPGSKIGS